MTVKNHQDFVAGLLFAAIGIAVAGFAPRYAIGTAREMGPGYFPLLLGSLLTFFGIVVLVNAVRSSAIVTRIKRPELRVIVLIFGSVALFGLLLNRMGLVVTVPCVVVLSSLASHEFSWKAAAVSSVVLGAFCIAVFHYALGLPLPVLPTLLN